jgi:aldehyde dehydrogenase (NAD+)
MLNRDASVPIERPDRFFIGGEWVTPSSSSQFDVLNSGTEKLFVKVAEAKTADIEQAVAAARHAFDDGPWPRLSPLERAGYMKAIAEEMRARAADLAQVWTIESGVIGSAASMTAPHFGHTWDYYAGLAATYPFIERHPSAAGLGLLVREPVGVVIAIVPWNLPPAIVSAKVAPALLAGCTVIVKVSPEAPVGGYIFAEICDKIGLPHGVVNVLTADRPVSEALVRHPGVDKITFTGSTAAGRRIASICGERIARCTLELGGKSAAIIFDDYDIDTAARELARNAVFLTGQVCASLTRIIVSHERHDAMVEALSAHFAAVKVGDPFDAATQMGPLAMARQRERVENYIARGKADGAQLAVGGARPAHLDRGYFIEPTVFGNVDNQSTIAQEEIFGPVLSVIPARSDKDAIRIANDTIYGLNNSIFTHDVERAYAAARQLRSGTVGHNGSRVDFSIAFGGFKQSGLGREGGVEGLLPFLETKTVVLAEDISPEALNGLNARRQTVS